MSHHLGDHGFQSAFGHRYQIQQKLSNKAGRQTYLAHDQQQNKQVIIKILNFDDALTWDHFKLFEREAKTLQNLSHPAIPKYLDYLDLNSEDFKGYALIQTYIQAQSLESYLQSGRTFSEAEIKQLAESLLEILTYLHSQNPPVIHRDIKPSNILLGDRSGNHLGQAYLVDFGSVQNIASKESGTITIVGSYGYIPFEQFCGQAVPASDLYSLGMTLLYLATGVHPAVLPQKQGQIQISSTGLSRQLEQWLKQMTSPDLDRRFSDAKSASNSLINNQIFNSIRLQKRPIYSKIQLRCHDNSLKITLSKSLNIHCVHIILLGLLGLFILLSLFFPVIGTLTLSFLFSMSIGFFLLVPAYWIFNTSYGKKCIRKIAINETEFIFNFGIFDNIVRRRHETDRLCYIPSHEFQRFYSQTMQDRVRVEPKLIIYNGTGEYLIEGLTDAEYTWLGQELSDFLGIELQVIYPTSKVPPEPFCRGGC